MRQAVVLHFDGRKLKRYYGTGTGCIIGSVDMWAKNRKLSVLVAAGYVFVVTTASLFHHHAGCDGEHCGSHSVARDGAPTCCHGEHEGEHSAPVSSVPRPGDNENCPICHFMAQKPVPADVVAPATSSMLVELMATVAPACPTGDVFTAWRSRAPPVVA